MKKYLAAVIVLLGLLVAMPTFASGGAGEVLYYGLGSVPTSESGFVYDTSTQSLYLPNDLHLPGFAYVGTLQAEDVETGNIGSDYGWIGELTAPSSSLFTANITQANITSLYVIGDSIMDGSLSVVGNVRGLSAGWFDSLISDHSLTFSNNSYASISALATGLKFAGNQFLFSEWDGTGACWVSKSLNGSVTKWHWTDNSGVDQATTSLGGVPTQCLDTDGNP